MATQSSSGEMRNYGLIDKVTRRYNTALLHKAQEFVFQNSETAQHSIRTRAKTRRLRVGDFLKDKSRQVPRKKRREFQLATNLSSFCGPSLEL